MTNKDWQRHMAYEALVMLGALAQLPKGAKRPTGETDPPIPFDFPNSAIP